MILEISNMNTINKMALLMRVVGDAEKEGNWAEDESTEFWYQAIAILGEVVEGFSQAIGVGEYCSGAKASEAEIMQDVMVLLKFEHYKAQLNYPVN